MTHKCTKCGKPCKYPNYKMIAIEKPYRNLFFHISCLEEIEKEFGMYPEGMALYLTKNLELWYN